MQPSSVMKGTSLPLGNIGEYAGMGACSPGKLQKNEIAKSCIPIF